MPDTPPTPLFSERPPADWPRTLDLWDDVASSAPPWVASASHEANEASWLMRRRARANLAFLALRGPVPADALAGFLPEPLTLVYLHAPSDLSVSLPGWRCRERVELQRLAAEAVPDASWPNLRPLTDADRAARRELAARVPDAAEGHATVTLGAFSPTGSLLGLAAAREVVHGAAHGAWVGPVAVCPDARRRGIGHALLAGLVRTLGESGTKLALDVEAANPGALAFYRRLGFSSYGAFCLTCWQRY